MINAIFMIAATLISVRAAAGHDAARAVPLPGLANGFAAVWICRLLPQELVASIARQLFRLLYRVEVKGIENFNAAGRKAVIVANHTSFLDGPLLSAYLPERCGFAINTHMAKRWWVKPRISLFRHGADRSDQSPGAPRPWWKRSRRAARS